MMFSLVVMFSMVVILLTLFPVWAFMGIMAVRHRSATNVASILFAVIFEYFFLITAMVLLLNLLQR